MLFLCLLFPLGFLIWCRAQGFEKFPKFALIAFTGLFPSAVFCAYKYFFSPFYYLAQDSFLMNFLYYFLTQAFVPLAVLTAAFLLMDGKDSLHDRLANIFPFYAGFYAIYIPFIILCEDVPYPFFALFAKPLIYFFMLASLPKICGELLERQRTNIKSSKKIFSIFALVAAILLPAVIESLWTLGVPSLFTVFLTLAYLAFAALISLIDR